MPHSIGLRGRILFRLLTLTGHTFAVPWVTMTKSGLFESPKPYLLVHNWRNSWIPLLASVRTSWKVVIYCIKGVLIILNHTPLYFCKYVFEIIHFGKLQLTWQFDTFIPIAGRAGEILPTSKIDPQIFLRG